MSKNTVRETIAQEFVRALNEEQLPWRAMWNSQSPYNAVTGKGYRGVNAFWLAWNASNKKYTDPRWCTYKQAQDRGWQVRKGEKSVPIEFWSLYDKKTKKTISMSEADKIVAADPDRKDDITYVARTSFVFNAAQIDGIPELEKPVQVDISVIRGQRDVLLNNMVLKFKEGGDKAFYRPSDDSITMPPDTSFKDDYAYMSVLLHECGHATGHESRLNRDLSGFFGSESYAKEELRAEIASAFTAQALGLVADAHEKIAHMDNHKAYIQSWAKAIKDAPNELFAAIKDAEKISDYLIEKGEFDRAPRSEIVQEVEYPHLSQAADFNVIKEHCSPEIMSLMEESIRLYTDTDKIISDGYGGLRHVEGEPVFESAIAWHEGEMDTKTFISEFGDIKKWPELMKKSITEFVRDGRTYEGSKIPLVFSEVPGFSDRSLVFKAVQEFEEKYNIPEIKRVIHDGTYDDKDFLYDAYDRYIGMSHANDSSLQQYLPQIEGIVSKMKYNPTNNIVAEVYYATQNGLSEEAIKYLLDNFESVDKMRTLRHGLEENLSLEALQIVSEANSAIRDEITAYLGDGSPENMKNAATLNKADIATFYRLKDEVKNGEVSHEMAKAIVETVNLITEVNAMDYSEKRSVDPSAKAWLNVFDLEWVSNTLVRVCMDDSTITPDTIRNIGKEFSSQTDVNNIQSFINSKGGARSFNPNNKPDTTTTINASLKDWQPNNVFKDISVIDTEQER